MEFNTNRFQSDIELNSIMATKNLTKKGDVEVFSKICAGEDAGKFANGDKIINFVKETGARAVAGDKNAQAELNNIKRVMIEAPLLKRLNIFDFMGEKIQVGINEDVKYKQFTLEGEKSRLQATNGSFPFASYNFTTKTMTTENITGGAVVDHYEFAHGNTDAINAMNEQVITDMMNKMFYKVQANLYESVKNATIKNFAEDSGITKASVDLVLKRAKRFGKVNIMGDYSVVSQLTDFAGFETNSTTKQFSQSIMDEVNKTGLISTYKGSQVVEIPNAYDLTSLTADGTFYNTYLPEGLLYFTVVGEKSPIKIGIKGGLRSMAGQDIDTATDIVRYDLAFGVVSLLDKPGYAGTLGLISDSNFSVDR